MGLIARAPKRETVQKEGYDPARLRRALQCKGEQLGPRQFKVWGQDEPFYNVDLDGDPVCYCKDSEYHGRGCKHELFAKLASGDMALLQAAGDELLKREQAAAALQRTTRRKNK
jgi:hypothetical protein